MARLMSRPYAFGDVLGRSLRGDALGGGAQSAVFSDHLGMKKDDCALRPFAARL